MLLLVALLVLLALQVLLVPLVLPVLPVVLVLQLPLVLLVLPVRSEPSENRPKSASGSPENSAPTRLYVLRPDFDQMLVDFCSTSIGVALTPPTLNKKLTTYALATFLHLLLEILQRLLSRPIKHHGQHGKLSLLIRRSLGRMDAYPWVFWGSMDSHLDCVISNHKQLLRAT